MSTFLFVSIAVEAHTTNPMPIAARLIERGHTVLWYAGKAFHERIARIGAIPLPYVAAPDFSGHDLFDFFPQLAGRSGPKVIGDAFDQIFVGHARARVADLRQIIATHKVDAMLTEGLSYGVGLVSELEGIPWATFGDGPLPALGDPDVPPFGPGMLPRRGAVGRLRNRVVATLAEKVLFRPAENTYQQIRAELGLPRDHRSALDNVTSPLLHMHASTPSFEYPHPSLPEHVRWIGALRPERPTWEPPVWWARLDSADVPIVHVTQGSLRPDLQELIVPALHALADESVLTVVTTGGATAAAVEAAYGSTLPTNCLVVPWIPYDELLAKASVFVTNGGYTGVTLALAHGVPIVQAGTTEEKAEIAARIQWTGVGLRLGKTHPSPEKIRGAVRRVLGEPSFRAAAARVQAEMAQHNAGNEGADLLLQLAARARLKSP